MNRPDELPLFDDTEVQALLAFDRALFSGRDSTSTAEAASYLQPVHECQRLLEAVWPRAVLPSLALPRREAPLLPSRRLLGPRPTAESGL